MKKIYWIAAVSLLSLRSLTSCVDLDITPTSIVTADDIYNEKGIKAYMYLRFLYSGGDVLPDIKRISNGY